MGTVTFLQLYPKRFSLKEFRGCHRKISIPKQKCVMQSRNIRQEKYVGGTQINHLFEEVSHE